MGPAGGPCCRWTSTARFHPQILTEPRTRLRRLLEVGAPARMGLEPATAPSARRRFYRSTRPPPTRWSAARGSTRRRGARHPRLCLQRRKPCWMRWGRARGRRGGRCDAPEGHERAPSHVPVDEEGVAQGFALGAGRVRGGGGGGGVLREAPVDDVRHGRAALHRRDARGLARARMLPRGLDPPALSVGIHGQEQDLALVRARRAAPHAHRLLRPAPRILLAQGPRARAPSRGVGARRAAAPRVGLLGAHAGLDGTAGDGHAHLSRRAARPRSLRESPFPPRIRFDNIEDGQMGRTILVSQRNFHPPNRRFPIRRWRARGQEGARGFDAFKGTRSLRYKRVERSLGRGV